MLQNWQVFVYLRVLQHYLFSLMRSQDWVTMSESSDLDAILSCNFWLVEFPIIPVQELPSTGCAYHAIQQHTQYFTDVN